MGANVKLLTFHYLLLLPTVQYLLVFPTQFDLYNLNTSTKCFTCSRVTMFSYSVITEALLGNFLSAHFWFISSVLNVKILVKKLTLVQVSLEHLGFLLLLIILPTLHLIFSYSCGGKCGL
jgi:hypothetical protein